MSISEILFPVWSRARNWSELGRQKWSSHYSLLLSVVNGNQCRGASGNPLVPTGPSLVSSSSSWMAAPLTRLSTRLTTTHLAEYLQKHLPAQEVAFQKLFPSFPSWPASPGNWPCPLPNAPCKLWFAQQPQGFRKAVGDFLWFFVSRFFILTSLASLTIIEGLIPVRGLFPVTHQHSFPYCMPADSATHLNVPLLALWQLTPCRLSEWQRQGDRSFWFSSVPSPLRSFWPDIWVWGKINGWKSWVFRWPLKRLFIHMIPAKIKGVSTFQPPQPTKIRSVFED